MTVKKLACYSTFVSAPQSGSLTGILLHNVPEKRLKKKPKELIWDIRLSSYKIECTEEGVKPCIIQLAHRTPKHGLEPLPCNGSASTYTTTSRSLTYTSLDHKTVSNIQIARKDERKKGK